jgi:hypothetical protein
VRDLPLPKTPEGATMATNDPESGEYRLTHTTGSIISVDAGRHL